jgi:hypothetical protein
METEAVTTNTPRQSTLANISLIFSLLAYILALLAFLLRIGPALCCALSCWIASLIFGILALVEIRTKRPAFKGRRQAIIGISSSAIPLIITIAFSWMIYLAIRGEPYQESDPASIIALIKENSNICFPENMQSLKALEKTASPPDPPYLLFSVSFETDQQGFTQLCDSLSKQDSYFEIHDYNAINPIYYSSEKDIPQWFKIDTKDIIYRGFGTTKNNAISLNTTCVRSEDPEKIVVYIEGLGRPRLRNN